MDVFVKKENKQSFVPIVGLLIVFLAFSVGSFIYIFRDNFIERLLNNSSLFLFAIFCFGFSIYGIVLFFKKPKKYSARLLSKELENYHGRKIWNMTFEVYKKAKRYDDVVPTKYSCFTYDDNAFLINNNYTVFLKELNWVITRVEGEDNQAVAVPNSTIMPVFIFILIILSFMELTCLFALFKENHKMMWLFMNGLFLYLIGYTLKFFKVYEKDNKVSNHVVDIGDTDTKLKQFNYDHKKRFNLVIIDLLKYALAIPVIWMIIFIILFGNFSFSYFVWGLVLSSIPEFMIIFLIIYYIGYDKRLLKRKKINTYEIANLSNIFKFDIMCSGSDTFSKYLVVDSSNNNLIYFIERTGFFRNKYIVYSFDGNIVARIDRKIFFFYFVFCCDDKP